MKKRLALSLLAVGILTSGLTASPWIAAAEGFSGFKDKLPGWAKADIEYAAGKGYMKGNEKGNFRPEATISRAEFAAILARVSNNTPDEGTTGFSSIPGWSQNEVNVAVSKGFISPSDYPNGFNPDTPLTRRELAKWVASGLAAKDEDFKKALADTADTLVPVAEYYKGGLNKADYPYVSVALGTGLMAGYPDGRFGPGQTTTRAEAAVILRRFEAIQDKKPVAFQDLKEMREVGLTGTNAISLGFKHRKYDDGREAAFANIRNVPYKLNNNLGTIKLNRFVLVNASKATEVKNLYGKMFVDKNYGSAFKMEKNRYELFVEYTVNSNVDNMDVMTYLNSSNDPFLHLIGFKSGAISKYGIKTMPRMDLVAKEKFFKKGFETKFWGNGFVNSNLPIYDTQNGAVITISGKTFSIYKED
ncbi:S-layer homology domain-containing protein [Paenibacillus sp. J22TS3]|uniref:S-layer homology domain-containing protein n=1 Tax=Paenibacillus sp. J22TS3 TaxID=2807192 RepID=UPI001B23190D|nr:S-layer homology domain-containing protein [Paenibacillus sp. J22TS3]GIP21567.1 hypothetical protein J22TS3_18420 [Paenibacillus sp. J22TS3]